MKNLFENWRKFINEAVELSGEERDAYWQDPRPSGYDPSCVTVQEIVDGIKYAQKTSEVSDDKDRRNQILKRYGKEYLSDASLAIGLAMISLTGVAGIAAGLGLAGAMTAMRAGKDAIKSMRNVPHDAVKGIDAFVDKINIAQPFQDVFSEHELRKIDDNYLEYLAREEPKTCIEAVMDINQFIQDHYKLCKDEYEPTRPINEVTTLDPELKQGFAEAIEDSQFWTLPNAEDDVDVGDHPDEMETPASEALRAMLNEKAQELDTDLYFIVTVSSEHALGKDDPYGGYPNNWMKHGMYQGPQSGRHVIWIELRPLATSYDMSQLNSSELVKKIARTINHEIVHYKQLKRQAQSKGISEEDAWQQMLDDPEQLPVGTDRAEYLSRHPEIDAYAHEAAEELIDKYGAQRALELIKQRNSNVIGVLADYRKIFKDDRDVMKRFLKKLYSQIVEAT